MMQPGVMMDFAVRGKHPSAYAEKNQEHDDVASLLKDLILYECHTDPGSVDQEEHNEYV